MGQEPNLNKRFPIQESLSPPIVEKPIYECAEAVYVTGFVPHATVRVYANTIDLVAEDTPPLGFAHMDLKRSLKLGESITATQTVGAITSQHSIKPVIVAALPEDAIKNQRPDVGDDLYECGVIVPVGNLVPSTRVHVTEDGVEVGDKAAAATWEAVFTNPLHAAGKVSAYQVACEGTDHEIKGPEADPVVVKPAPVPIPKAGVHGPSLIVGNDAVGLTGLLVGAEVDVTDAGTHVGGGFATGSWNTCPISAPVKATSKIEVTQALCGNVSKPSDPVTPTSELKAPIVLGPICAKSQFVVVRGTTINAIVIVFRNGGIVAYGGSGPGDVVLALGSGMTLAAGDVVTALQYMGPTISPVSSPVIVVSHLSQPVIEILGGEPFFTPKGGEIPIDGPVFPRGRAGGVVIRVQACCPEKVQLVIAAPDGTPLDEPTLTEIYPGYYGATWDWSSKGGWSVPEEVPVGAYTITVTTGCNQKSARATFYVIFDPDEVGGPPRFSFDPTAVWFGTDTNLLRGLHYYLHPSDARVFSIAINAASGLTNAMKAATAVARAEEKLFAYSLNFHTKDVIDLLVNYTEAQCADDACCLTALLRAIGIPAHPVTADAGLETGAAHWTFDTWTEFLADDAGKVDWRIFHPHEYPGMAAESRGVFGTTRGVAVKSFNDVIVMANENWVAGQLDDATADVTYGRNACLEPQEKLTKAAWIGELCEAGYWTSTHWDCGGVGARIGSERGFRIDESDLRFGGRLGGNVEIVNAGTERRFGRLAVELVSSVTEAKAFVDRTFGESVTRGTLDPGQSMTIPFVLELPETLDPGASLFLRALIDEQTIVLHEVRIAPLVTVEADVPDEIVEGGQASVSAVVRHHGEDVLRNVRVELRAPFALAVGDRPIVRLGDLRPGETRELSWTVIAVAALESGSLQVSAATDNGGGAVSRRHFAVRGGEPEIEFRPVGTRPG